MGEQRLIDAMSTVTKISKKVQPFLRTGNSARELYDTILGCFAEAPTVDAVEVVHGRWIFKHNPITDPKKYFIRIVCSECNLHTGQKSNYCPQCGAKMDGGETDGSEG